MDFVLLGLVGFAFFCLILNTIVLIFSVNQARRLSDEQEAEDALTAMFNGEKFPPIETTE